MILATEFNHDILGNLAIVWGYIDTTGDSYQYYSLYQILTDISLYRSLKANRNFTITVNTFRGVALPTLCGEKDFEENDNVTNFCESYNLNSLYDMTLSETELADVVDLLKDDMPKINQEEFHQLVLDAVECLDSICTKTFKYIVDPTLSRDVIKVINDYNAQSSGEEIDYTELKKVNNSSVIMYKDSDEIFFGIPKPFYCRDEKIHDIVADQMEKIWAQFFLIKPYGMELKEQPNAGNFMEVLKGVNVSTIFGDDKNNSMGLQPNEQKFYNALVEYINRYMKIYCEVEGLSDEVMNHSLTNCNIPQSLENILNTFIRVMVNINWRHSSLVPLNELDNYDDDDSDSDDDEDKGDTAPSVATDRLRFADSDTDIRSGRKQSKTYRDYCSTLKDFIHDCEGTAYSYAELIIKLARWGSRKPRVLNLSFEKSHSNGRYNMDIVDFKIVMNDEVVESMVKDFNGYSYMLTGVILSPEDGITMKEEPSLYSALEMKSIQKIPSSIIGVKCIQQIVRQEETELRLICMDLLTLIDLYREGKHPIYGIEMSDEFEVVASDKIYDDAMYIMDAEAVLQSKDKVRNKFVQNVSPILNVYPEMTKDNLKNCNLIVYTKLLAMSSSIGLLLRGANDLGQIYNKWSKPVLSYFADMELMSNNGEQTLNLEMALNCLAGYYTGNEINGELSGVARTDNSSGKTSIFNSSTTQEPTRPQPKIIFQATVDLCYIVTPTQNKIVAEHGCLAEMVKFNQPLEQLDTSKVESHVKSLLAVKNILILAKDKMFRNKIYVSAETLSEIDMMCERIYKTKDYDLIIKAIDKQIKK